MGARIPEYPAAQGTNRFSIRLEVASLGSIPLEIEIRNVVTRDELPQLGDELLKQFNDEVKGWSGRFIGFSGRPGSLSKLLKNNFFRFFLKQICHTSANFLKQF